MEASSPRRRGTPEAMRSRICCPVRPQQTQPGQQPTQPGMGTMRQNVTPDVRGQLRQGIGLETQPAMKAAGGAYA